MPAKPNFTANITMREIKEHYSLESILELINSGDKICYSPHILQRINESVQALEDYLQEGKPAVYGVNTGFGSLQNVRIPDNELEELQRNLLITHAAGTGNALNSGIVKTMLLLKIINIGKGYSAVRAEVAERLIWHYNNDWIPVVHEQGSLGASGDLAPLSEMCLSLLGLGTLEHPVFGAISAENVLLENGLKPIPLKQKEALALINGTQFMLAHALQVTAAATSILDRLHTMAALSADVWLCRQDPFRLELHRIRPHTGQKQAAENMLQLLKQSPMQTLPRPAVQDPYSFRCIPQVHGASIDALNHCFSVWETELNSVTDNPTVFAEEKVVLSGGNFHGQPLALTLDYAAMALAELANISERRTYLLISGQRDLPAFLATKPGTDSGYMIAQYTAASIVSKNKQLCTPASVDSIVSSNGQEDHVSMGANAAVKALQVAKNVQDVLSIEWLCANQALSFRQGKTFPEAENMRMKLGQDEHTQVPMHELISRSKLSLFGR
ncbi:MAG: aromatic amino acid lyase [Sphingomonadales bacterium]|nr:aromatic amino acid lyase [Sphingomonadales bacterium]